MQAKRLSLLVIAQASRGLRPTVSTAGMMPPGAIHKKNSAKFIHVTAFTSHDIRLFRDDGALEHGPLFAVVAVYTGRAARIRHCLEHDRPERQSSAITCRRTVL